MMSDFKKYQFFKMDWFCESYHFYRTKRRFCIRSLDEILSYHLNELRKEFISRKRQIKVDYDFEYNDYRSYVTYQSLIFSIKMKGKSLKKIRDMVETYHQYRSLIFQSYYDYKIASESIVNRCNNYPKRHRRKFLKILNNKRIMKIRSVK